VDATDPADIVLVCQRIIDAFKTAFDLDGGPLWSSVSVGAAVFPNHGEDQDALYKSSDQALYAAKAAGRNTWRICRSGEQG
jgi:GGDEF domain-containing protein